MAATEEKQCRRYIHLPPANTNLASAVDTFILKKASDFLALRASGRTTIYSIEKLPIFLEELISSLNNPEIYERLRGKKIEDAASNSTEGLLTFLRQDLKNIQVEYGQDPSGIKYAAIYKDIQKAPEFFIVYKEGQLAQAPIVYVHNLNEDKGEKGSHYLHAPDTSAKTTFTAIAPN